jgi:hypothetical protein
MMEVVASTECLNEEGYWIVRRLWVAGFSNSV